MKIVKFIQRRLRRLGYEVVPYPPSDWVRQRDSVRRVLNRLSIDCVFDVGANHGQYGDFLRDIGYTGWIVSFEPVKAHFEDLSRRAAARPPWRVFRWALGSADGEAEINVNEDDSLTSFLASRGPSESLPRNRAIGRETVTIHRLDSVFSECTAGLAANRFYLKLDTQGYDLEAVRGADGVLAHFSAMQTEVSFIAIYEGMPTYIESLRELECRGFGVADFMPVTRTADGLFLIEMDCILVRQPDHPTSSVARG